MPISTTIRKVQYDISGSVPATFTIPFKYWDISEIRATISPASGSDIVLSLTADFTLSAPGASGTLTRVGTWPSGVRLTIWRELENVQETDWTDGDAIYTASLEEVVDKLTAQVQELKEDNSRRISTPITDPVGTSVELPDVASRATRFIACDDVGNIIPANAVTGVPVTAYMETLLDDPDADTAQSTLGISDYAKTLLDDPDADTAQSTLGLNYQDISSDTALPRVALQRHIATAPVDLTLPASPVLGDSLEVVAKSNTYIIQPDANSLIVGGKRDRYKTTKGTAGKVQLTPGTYVHLAYQGDIDLLTGTYTKITDPAALPAGTGYGASWSPDGRYLAIAHATTPFVTIYDWSSGSPVKITNPAALPAYTGQIASWSINGRYLAIAHSGTPFVTIYDWSSGSPVKITNPAALPAGTGYGASWSPDGRYLAIAHDTTPFVTIYDWSSGSPVKITDPAALPANTGRCSSWSINGRYLAIGHNTTPYVTIYDWSSGSPVKITNPAALPANTVFGASWSPDGRYLAIAHDTTPFVTIYDWSSGSPVKITNPAALPANTGRCSSWSPDGRYLAIGHNTTPYVTIYDTVSEAFASACWRIISDPTQCVFF